MFTNYFKIALRNLINQRFLTVVNIVGLAIGLAACFLIFQYIYFETTYDRFHGNIDRLYRVGIRYSGDASDAGSAANHPAAGPAIKAEFAEVQDYARLFPLTVFLGMTPAGANIKSGIVVSASESGSEKVFHEEKILK